MTETTGMHRSFEQFMQDKMETLELYTKAIAKVHGPHHPEIIEVRRIFEIIKEKLANGATDFTEEFKELKERTNDYQVPTDTCETTTASYQMLEEADRLYHNDLMA